MRDRLAQRYCRAHTAPAYVSYTPKDVKLYTSRLGLRGMRGVETRDVVLGRSGVERQNSMRAWICLLALTWFGCSSPNGSSRSSAGATSGGAGGRGSGGSSSGGEAAGGATGGTTGG